MDHAWTQQAEWMRQHGATVATWDSGGNLLSLTLGPAPVTPKTQPERPLDESKQGAIVRPRIASAPGLTRPLASGGSK